MQSDDSSVVDDEVLYRRIARYGDTSMMVVDEGTGDVRVSKAAFKLDSDGCSVYLHSVLAQNELAADSLVRDPQNVIISVTAGSVRAVGLGVRPDPWPPDGDGHPRDAAHALVVNPNAIGKNPLHRALRSLAATSTICLSPA
jgi:hypothetical protein